MIIAIKMVSDRMHANTNMAECSMKIKSWRKVMQWQLFPLLVLRSAPRHLTKCRMKTSTESSVIRVTDVTEAHDSVSLLLPSQLKVLQDAYLNARVAEHCQKWRRRNLCETQRVQAKEQYKKKAKKRINVTQPHRKQVQLKAPKQQHAHFRPFSPRVEHVTLKRREL